MGRGRGGVGRGGVGWWWWWCEDVNIKDLKELSIDLKGLLPDYLKLKAGGTTERAKPWGDLVANSLAARFRLYCMAQKVSAEVTWVPFLEIYPTEDPHLRRVLKPFEVCWSEGVDYVRGTTVESKAGKAIKSNRNFETAHHDLLIPVKSKATGNLEFVAAQCCWRVVPGSVPPWRAGARSELSFQFSFPRASTSVLLLGAFLTLSF